MIQNGNYYIAMLPAVMVALIVVAILLPIEVFESLMAPLNAHLAEQNSPLPAGKLGHIGCFALLSAFLLSVRKRLDIELGTLYAVKVLLAVATEGFQLFVPGRTPHPLDLVFDLTGISIGTALFLIVFQCSRLFSTSSKPNSGLDSH